jgi:hypothetical protein
MQNKMENITVFSWNVLSNSFFTCDDYPSYNRTIFDSNRKIQQILKIISTQMKSKTLIALQEVCDDLRSELIILGINNGYTIRDAYYGNEKTGNMGVVLMWPTNLYKLTQYEQIVVGQNIDADPPSIPKRGWIDWLWGVKPPKCPLEYAKQRENVLIVANLIGPFGPFTFAVYHMPCAFWDERIMKYHLETVWDICHNTNDPVGVFLEQFKCPKECPQESSIKRFPLILCMDMNTKLNTPLYNFMLKQDMISAHVFKETEPLFTVWSQSKFEIKPFKEMIDYIWITKDLISKAETEIADCECMLPNENYPSDHLWIRVSITFNQ